MCAFKGNCQLTTNSMLPTVKDNGWRCYSRALEHRRTVGGHGWQRKDARKVTLANRLLFPLRCAQSALPLVSSARKGRDSSQGRHTPLSPPSLSLPPSLTLFVSCTCDSADPTHAYSETSSSLSLSHTHTHSVLGHLNCVD